MVRSNTIFEDKHSVSRNKSRGKAWPMEDGEPPKIDYTSPNLDREISKQQVQKLDDLVSQSERILYTTSAVFPFDFFPNKLIVDELKINIVNWEFFWAEQVKSIMIKDIVTVTVETGPFFATLVLTDRTASTNSDTPTNTNTIKYLWKHEAARARRIIQGLKISAEQKVNVTAMKTTELVAKLEEIGRAREV